MDKLEGYLILAAIAGGVYLVWSTKADIKDAAAAVNPVRNDNAIANAANALAGKDNKTSSIGTGFFDWLNPNQPVFTPGRVKVTPTKASAL